MVSTVVGNRAGHFRSGDDDEESRRSPAPAGSRQPCAVPCSFIDAPPFRGVELTQCVERAVRRSALRCTATTLLGCPNTRSARTPGTDVRSPAVGANCRVRARQGSRARHPPAARPRDTRCGALPDSDPERPAHRTRGDIPVPLTSSPHACLRAGRRSYRRRERCRCSSPTRKDRMYSDPPHTDRESVLRPREGLPSPPRSAVRPE